MAPRNATLKALLVATLLVSFLLFPGALGVDDFHCCFCKCYKKCKIDNPHPKYKDYCRSKCLKQDCQISCSYIGHCNAPSYDGLAGPGKGVVAGAGGKWLGKINGTREAAGAP
ncbi:hypothetical protein ACP70R_036873 [Stipagrostis hirtigluma subsp. patula]